ncbi:hypothetical protein D3C84_948770 [compost metagenome]
MQAHFVGFIEDAGVWACGVKTCVYIQQVGIVLIGVAKPVDHQLGQGHGRRWRPVFPTGEGFRVTGCPVKAVEIHLIRIKAGDRVLFQ